MRLVVALLVAAVWWPALCEPHVAGLANRTDSDFGNSSQPEVSGAVPANDQPAAEQTVATDPSASPDDRTLLSPRGRAGEDSREPAAEQSGADGVTESEASWWKGGKWGGK